jgi:hypothetical protein
MMTIVEKLPCSGKNKHVKFSSTNLVSQRAMIWGRGEEFHIRTEIVAATFTVFAPPTTDSWFKRHTITCCKCLYLTSNFFYDPSTLMANNHWLFHHKMCTPQCLTKRKPNWLMVQENDNAIMLTVMKLMHGTTRAVYLEVMNITSTDTNCFHANSYIMWA